MDLGKTKLIQQTIINTTSFLICKWYHNYQLIIENLLFKQNTETQGVSQNFYALEHGVWGRSLKAPHGFAQKAPNEVWGKAPENFGYLALTCFFL